MTTTEDEEVTMPQQGHRVVLLVGFMGAGKTSVGRMLAEQLQWRFVDLDDMVVAREGRSVAQIFEEAGESGFRSRESTALQELLLGSTYSGNTVVALGGGSLSHPETRTAINRSGFPKIFLDASVEELYQRCISQNILRPLLKDLNAFRELYLSRLPHYSENATRVETGSRTVAEISNMVHSLLKNDVMPLKETD